MIANLLIGKAICVGDHIDTDAIIPARYCTSFREEDLGPHSMEGLEPSLSHLKLSGRIIVAGVNFGCGSAREHAPLSIKGAGILCIVAVSFSRTFFRNSINIGLPVFELGDAKKIQDGDLLEIDSGECLVRNLTKREEFQALPFPDYIRRVIEAGGMIEFARRRLAEKKGSK